MVLKAIIKCSCGCSYEIVSSKEHTSATCPNCSKKFSESDKLVNILKIFDTINLTPEESSSDDMFKTIFQHETLTLATIDDFSEAIYPHDNN